MEFIEYHIVELVDNKLNSFHEDVEMNFDEKSFIDEENDEINKLIEVVVIVKIF